MRGLVYFLAFCLTLLASEALAAASGHHAGAPAGAMTAQTDCADCQASCALGCATGGHASCDASASCTLQPLAAGPAAWLLPAAKANGLRISSDQTVAQPGRSPEPPRPKH